MTSLNMIVIVLLLGLMGCDSESKSSVEPVKEVQTVENKKECQVFGLSGDQARVLAKELELRSDDLQKFLKEDHGDREKKMAAISAILGASLKKVNLPDFGQYIKSDEFLKLFDSVASNAGHIKMLQCDTN